MASLNKAPYKGTRDFFPADMRFRNFVFEKMAAVSETFCYEPYDGPLLEEIELYYAKSGEELINDQIYSFVDRGDRKVAIRPEMTPTVARMVAQIHREVAKPLRWYAIPNLMRYEKPQKGRLREFWQYNADVFGAGEYGDVEIIQLAVQILRSFGANASQFAIHINDRRLVDFIFTGLIGLDAEANKKLYKLVDRKNKMDPAKFAAEVRTITKDESQANAFEAYVALATIADVERFMETKNSEAAAPLVKLFKTLGELGLSEYVLFDPSIVRGLDYYTGVVFEIFDKHPENNRAIAGGGAYANLLQIFNEQPLGGVGFGMGEVPLKEFLKAHNLIQDFSKAQVDVMVTYSLASSEGDAFILADRLRAQNLKVEMIFGETKAKKAFTQAERKNTTAVVLLGEESQVKNLSTRESRPLDLGNINALVEFVKGKN
jgi:histidyl-tRNA synthetase